MDFVVVLILGTNWVNDVVDELMILYPFEEGVYFVNSQVATGSDALLDYIEVGLVRDAAIFAVVLREYFKYRYVAQTCKIRKSVLLNHMLFSEVLLLSLHTR